MDPRQSLPRLALKIALLVTLLIVARFVGMRITEIVTPVLTGASDPAMFWVIVAAMSVYVLLMMLPFVPGMEIGLAVMMALGPAIVPIVYAATVLALSLAFLVGRTVPQATLIAGFDSLGMRRAAGVLRELAPLDPDERRAFLLRNASSQAVPFLLRYRFVTLACALNLPGNSVIGGGGGICLVAGLCRLCHFHGFLLTVALAVMPVPLIFYFSG